MRSRDSTPGRGNREPREHEAPGQSCPTCLNSTSGGGLTACPQLLWPRADCVEGWQRQAVPVTGKVLRERGAASVYGALAWGGGGRRVMPGEREPGHVVGLWLSLHPLRRLLGKQAAQDLVPDRQEPSRTWLRRDELQGPCWWPGPRAPDSPCPGPRPLTGQCGRGFVPLCGPYISSQRAGPRGREHPSRLHHSGCSLIPWGGAWGVRPRALDSRPPPPSATLWDRLVSLKLRLQVPGRGWGGAP